MQAIGSISPESFVKVMSQPQEERRSLLEILGRKTMNDNSATDAPESEPSKK